MKKIQYYMMALVGFVGLLGGTPLWATNNPPVQKPHTFVAGQVSSSSQVNENFDTVYNRVNEMRFALVPIGAIIPWHKSASTNPTLTLPDGWVECDGRAITDADSPFNGQNSPDLNNTGLFVRGSSVSGVVQEDAFQGHYHETRTLGTDSPTTLASAANTGAFLDHPGDPNCCGRTGGYVAEAKNDGTNGEPRTASETRPKNMSMVWIMRIK